MPNPKLTYPQQDLLRQLFDLEVSRPHFVKPYTSWTGVKSAWRATAGVLDRLGLAVVKFPDGKPVKARISAAGLKLARTLWP